LIPLVRDSPSSSKRAERLPDPVVGQRNTQAAEVVSVHNAQHSAVMEPPIARQYGRFLGEFMVSLIFARFRTIWVSR
jgi:hypothetical protein